MAGSEEESDYSLKIDDVQLHDDGVFECQVRFVPLMWDFQQCCLNPKCLIFKEKFTPSIFIFDSYHIQAHVSTNNHRTGPRLEFSLELSFILLPKSDQDFHTLA